MAAEWKGWGSSKAEANALHDLAMDKVQAFRAEHMRA